MNVQRVLLCTVLIPLLAFSPTRDEVRFSPASDSSAIKTFVIHGSWTSDEVTLEVSGTQAEVSIEAEWTRRVEVTDTYVSTAEGRPRELERSFEEIGEEQKCVFDVQLLGFESAEASTGERTSELEGETVSFTWDEDNGSYRVAFVDEDADEELLEGLVEDMDLRALLPEDAVAEGDRWEPEVVALAALFVPGGGLSLTTEADTDLVSLPMLAAGLTPAVLTDLNVLIGTVDDGDVQAVYRGTREEDGERLAVIEFKVDFETSHDLHEWMEALLDPVTEEFPGSDLEGADLEFTFEGEGLLLWNLSAGRAHSFELEGETTATLERRMSLNTGRTMVEITTLIDLSGEVQCRVTVE